MVNWKRIVAGLIIGILVGSIFGVIAGLLRNEGLDTYATVAIGLAGGLSAGIAVAIVRPQNLVKRDKA